jgi:DNA-binding NtrC family response regulator
MTRLLVVDDEPGVLFAMEKCLGPLQVQVITAASGQAAMDVAESEHPDVVILDVCLPDMPWLDVYDRIHENHPQTPIIVVTPSAKTDTALEARKRGAFECLVKPIDVERLREVVARAAEASQQRGAPVQPSELDDRNNAGADDFPAIAALARELIERMPGDVYRKLASAVDSVVLDVALRHTKGNQLHAAMLLGISRTTLRAKLRALGFTVEKQLATEDNGAASRLK